MLERWLPNPLRAKSRRPEVSRVCAGEVEKSMTDLELLAQWEEKCSWPGLYYDKIGNLISVCKPRLVVEIGVAYGFHATRILEQHPAIEYIGVDPYVAGYDPEDLFDRDVGEVFGVSPNKAMDRLFTTVSEKLQLGFPGRFQLLRMKSTEAAKTFPDESLDFVFVDGDHREEAVREDLEAWWPKIQPGGVLVGDDYSWPGVEKAVTVFFREAGNEVLVLQTAGKKHQSFWVLKPSPEVTDLQT